MAASDRSDSSAVIGDAERVVHQIARRKREMDRLARIAGKTQGIHRAALRRAGRLSVQAGDAVAALYEAEHAWRRRLVVSVSAAMVIVLIALVLIAAHR